MDRHELSGGEPVCECRALFEACTPELYRRNIFRITGLPVDASTRDMKRRIDELKAAEEMGEIASEFTHAFAPKPPPSQDLLRETGQRLVDPERRIIDEFFWFWPMEWGNSIHDEGLAALSEGQLSAALEFWFSVNASAIEPDSVIAVHNLAIYNHIFAVERDIDINLKANANPDTVDNWIASLQYWARAVSDDEFWSVFTERIRLLNDPQLTTGFARRIKGTIYEALLRLNFSLSLRAAESGNVYYVNAQEYIRRSSSWSSALALRALASVTKPLRTRVQNAVSTISERLQQGSLAPSDCALELQAAVTEPMNSLQLLLPHDSSEYADTCDLVGSLLLKCSKMCPNAQSAIAILNTAKRYAATTDLRTSIEADSQVANSMICFEAVSKWCGAQIQKANNSPGTGNSLAIQLHKQLPTLLSGITDPQTLLLAKDLIAGAMNACAVTYGNSTHQWSSCAGVLRDAYLLASDPVLKAHIGENQRVAIGNVQNNPLGCSGTGCVCSAIPLFVFGLISLASDLIIILLNKR
jgi:hypothetical protein